MASTESHNDEYQAAWQECILNDRPIDWDFWVQKMPVLSAVQASALMHGLDPGIDRGISNIDAEVKKAMAETKRLISLAEAHRVDQLSPGEWLDWVDSHKLVVHTMYRIAVEKRNATLDTMHTGQPGSLKSHKEKIVPDWIPEAQKLAKAYMQQQLANDYHPPQIHIADWVAKQFREKKIYGLQGKPISGSTIKRHALVGISTQHDKLKSIEKQWGKQGKK